MTSVEPTGTIDALADVLRGRRTVVVTGAGCSTGSGIPDYRGNGFKPRAKPIQYRAFVSDSAVRQRYWARSTVGWRRVFDARPNPAHDAIARLEARGHAIGVVTQNVDGLHQRAGSRAVVELHGSLSRVRCLTCGGLEPRVALQARLLALNPDLRDADAAFAPDGDADVAPERMRAFRVPSCTVCNGMLKPDVVFFGENVPKARVREAWDLYDAADAVLVVGSSLAVFSGYRFVLRAAQEGRPVIIVNRGETRGDEHAAAKVDGAVESVLPLVVERLH